MLITISTFSCTYLQSICLFISFTYFKICLFFLIGEFETSLYSLQTNALQTLWLENVMLSIFWCVHWSFIFLLWGISADHFQIFILYYFKTFLYILNTSPLSSVCVVNFFSQSVTCIFIFLMFFAEQKVFILMKSSWWAISIICCAFGGISKNSLANLGLWRFSPTLFSLSFIVLRFTFGAIMHSEAFFSFNVFCFLYKLWGLSWGFCLLHMDV